MTAESGGCGCSKRSAWICVFLSILVIAFTSHLAAVLTPSWQYVYLEDGRTEHHHGLWLDCKRDYSNEYGRPREYYESLYRINHLQNPFDQFWLPYLQCVYKFDYWIDDEDWYEHGYDENRLQGDAYQHLFIGWKIAVFTAHSFALVCSFNAIIMLFCGFYHRLLVCVAAVFVTLSTISTVIGNGVFYMFASYQDNNIIREDDGIYEQYFGWSFYASLVANLILLIASVIGCTATSAILSAERTRLVKIEMDETGDGARLLRMNAVGGFIKNRSHADNQPLSSTSDSDESASRFRRSKSAVYKIDSNALRKWEKDAMRGIALSSSVPDFKRANSLPNVGKKNTKTMSSSRQSLHKGLSNSDLSNTLLSDMSSSAVATVTTREFIPSRELPNAKRSDLLPNRISNSKRSENELIYECVDENSLPFEDNNSSAFASKTGTFDRNQWLKPITNRNEMASNQGATTTMNTYDRVPMGALDLDKDEYLKPRSVSSGNNSESNASFSGGTFCGIETTFVAKPNLQSVRKQQELEKENQKKILCTELQQKQQQRRQNNEQFGRSKSVFEQEIFEREERLKCSTNFGITNLANNKSVEKNTPIILTELNAQKQCHRQYPLPTAPYLTLKSNETREHRNTHGVDKAEESKKWDSAISHFQINTFQTDSPNGTHTATKSTLTAGNSASNNRSSLVNLVNVASEQASTVSVFDRRDSIDFSAELDAALRSPQPLSLTSTTPTRRSADSTAKAIVESANSKWRSPSRTANAAQPKHQYFGSFAAGTTSSTMFDDIVEQQQSNIKETNFNGSNFTTPTKDYYYPPGSAGDGLSMCAESEMDRSMGSTTFTFNLAGIQQQQPMGNSPGSFTSTSVTASPWRKNSALLHHPKEFGGSERTMI